MDVNGFQSNFSCEFCVIVGLCQNKNQEEGVDVETEEMILTTREGLSGGGDVGRGERIVLTIPHPLDAAR